MRFSITQFTSDRGVPPATVARLAEAEGFHAFYVPEHTHIPTARETAHPGTGTAELPDDRYLRTLDPWVALATAAQITSEIRLGTTVALPLEHDPITLAKTIATLDHLSGGRVTLGAGFGWNREEMADHGVDPARRKSALADYLAAMRSLWEQETASHEGDFVRFGASWSWPKPPQQPVPVLLGAAGNEKNLRWIARHADGWITTPGETEVAAPLELLAKAWSEAGRSGVPQVLVLAPRIDPDQVRAWAEQGVTEVILGVPDKGEDDVVAYLGRRGDTARALTTA